MEISFCNLRCKDVINVCDGKNLGNITDMLIDTCCGRVLGIVVPCNKNFFSLFKSNNDIFIPYNRICKIGKDIILVDIIMQATCDEHNSICTCRTQNNQNIDNINMQKLNIQTKFNDIDINKSK